MITQISDSLHAKLNNTFENKVLLGNADLKELRKQAFDKFSSLGLPTIKNEDWKYTQIQTVLKHDFALEPQFEGSDVDFSKFQIPGLDAYSLIFINGVFQPQSSTLPTMEGVTIAEFDQAKDNSVFLKHFAQHADKTENAFVSLNTAISSNVLFIHFAKNVVLDKPLHLVRYTDTSHSSLTQNRTLVVLDSFAQAEILESFVGKDSEAENLNVGVTEVFTDVQSSLQHYMIQKSSDNNVYVNHVEAVQKKHSLYNNYNVNFPGSKWVRNDINLRLDDPETEGHLYGVVLSADKQLIDNHTIVDHALPHCESYEWYKTIAQGESTSVFNGKIFVRQDAQKTNAFQQNNNIIIGEKATINSKPQLEIFADDVKCSHGCTIGQFDDEALFYLRARGIGEEKARAMMVQAFAFDVTSRFENEVIRDYVNHQIEENLI